MSTAIEAPETVESEQAEVSCDGGGDLGHPRVYLNMGESGEIVCPYCDRKFVLIPSRAP
ncbi:MAG: zinc-finger domain-containing protein [Alphaproteobacteria bacterium]